MTQRLQALDQIVDSLRIEVDQKEMFIQNFNRIRTGDTSNTELNLAVRSENQPYTKPASLKAEPVDSAFRKEYEQSGLSLISLTNSRNRDLEETFFYAPISGII